MVDQDAPAGRPSLPPALSPISSQALYCLKRFETICDELQIPKQETAIQNGYNRNLVLLTMQDSCAKFKAWGTSIAAFRQVHVPTSLDFRLRDALEIRSTLLGVLEYLGEYLNDAYVIILGNNPNQADDESSNSDSENESEENANSNALNSAQDTSYLQELCMAISSSNGSLMKLSILIRKSSNRDDYLKAASRYSTWTPSPFISHVREKYGSAKGSKEWLVERLGKAIMRRSQFLMYRKEHHGKLTGDWGEDLDEVIEEKGPDPLKLARTVASTKATTFIVDGDASKKEVSEREVSDFTAGSFGSQTSYEATEFEGDGTAPTKLTVPLPPEWAFPDVPFEYGEPFQCPYCYTEQEVKNKAAWKKHIFRDLKPYVCTFAGCAMRMFRSRNEWFAHEMQRHRREWVCQHCQHAAFASASEFSCHLEVTHSKVLENFQLKALLLQSEEPVDKIRSNACPLCDEWESDLNNLNQDAKKQHLNGGKDVEPYGTIKQFRRHLGRHMEQLALFSLPIKESDDLENDTSATAGRPTMSMEEALEEERLNVMELLQGLSNKPPQQPREPGSPVGPGAVEADDNDSESSDDVTTELYFCDYLNCKHTKGFDRKDQCREHYREYHREDLVTNQQRDIELWLQDRDVISVWWRCSRCLKRNQTGGEWKCGDCNQMCEKVRIVARESNLEGAESKLKAALSELQATVLKDKAAASKEEAKPLTSTTSETAIEKMEGIMLHYHTMIQPACARFIFAPQATDLEEMDLEYNMLGDRVMNEVLLKIDGIDIEGNSKGWQKKASFIEELQGTLNQLNEVMLNQHSVSIKLLVQNGSLTGLPGDGQEGGDNSSSLNRGKPTTEKKKWASRVGSDDEETKEPVPEPLEEDNVMDAELFGDFVSENDKKKNKGDVFSFEDPPAETSVVVPEPGAPPPAEDSWDNWGRAKNKGKYPSEQDKTTSMSEDQHSLNSIPGAQPNDSSIIDKTEDDKHQERDSVDRDSKDSVGPAAESSAKEVQIPQERDLVNRDSKDAVEPAAGSPAKEVQMSQERDLLQRNSKESVEPTAESSAKEVEMPQEQPSYTLPARTTTTSSNWRCTGCKTVNRHKNNCTGCGYHKSQRWKKMIFCGYCGDGPYLAANSIGCMRESCYRMFDEYSPIKWQPAL